MDKEEFRIKLEQINHLVEAKDYRGAMEVVDSIDWRRVKNVRTLCVVGEIYAANKRYEESRDIFLLAYHRSSIGKNILYRLVEISLKLGDIEEANDYYEEYRSVAPNDNTLYLLKYKILKEKKAPLDEQIAVLEEYKDKEFTEKWSYELAKLYYKAGKKDKCKDLCDEMILWFSEGNYVMKALDLKMRMGVLTESEKEKYEKQLIPKVKELKEAVSEEDTQEEKSEEMKDEESGEDISEASEESTEEDISAEKEEESEEEAEETPAEEASEENEEVQPEETPEAAEENEDSSEEKDSDSSEEAEENIAEEAAEEKHEESSLKVPEVPEKVSYVMDDNASGSSSEKASDMTEDDDDFPKMISEEEEEENDDDLLPDDDDLDDDFGDDPDEREIPIIDSIQIRSSKDLEGTLTFQERITKGIRELFGGRKKESFKKEEDYVDLDEDEMVNDSISSEENEEEISDNSAENNETVIEEESIEEKEEEHKEKEDFSKTSRIPEFHLPKAIRRVKNKDTQDKKEVEIIEEVIEKEEASETPKEDFNLEDTILAAATAQGIIPESESEEASAEKPAEEDEEKQEEKSESDGTGETEEAPEKENDSLLSEKTDENVPDLSEDDLVKINEDLIDDGITGYPDEEKNTIPDEVSDLLPDDDSIKIEAASEDKMISDVILPEEDPYELMYLDNKRRCDSYETAFFSVNKKEYLNPSLRKKREEKRKILTEEEQYEEYLKSVKGDEYKEPVEISLRDKDLTEEEEILFSYFVTVPGMKEQLIDTLYNVQEGASDRTSKTGNVIVMGGSESGKTRLISALIPAICKELNLNASKVAYVFADQINGKNIDYIFRKLAGGFFVIEKANQLDQDTAQKIEEAMNRDTGGMIVILEDDKIGMRKLMTRYPRLAKKFDSIINIPVFTNDELANFANIYALENGYRIDNMAMLVLYNLIGMNQKEDMPMSIGAVKGIVDSAISKAQGGFRVFKKNASKKRMDSEGYIVLHEKDFNLK